MKTASNIVVPLAEVTLMDASRVGNKAAVLGELTRNQLNVPDGFCITTNYFRDLLRSLRLFEGFRKGRSCGSHEWSKVADRIVNSDFPSRFTRAIESAVNQIRVAENAPRMYCVRSSASIEDRPDHSFAGQFHTSVGMVNLQEILSAIKRCWASLFDDRVIVYTAKLGTHVVDATMAVLVQAMIPAEKSGVLFTVDPRTRESVMTIESTWGLGLPLVSGEISPDSTRISPSGKLISQQIGTKRFALQMTELGVRKVQLAPSLRRAVSLLDDDLSLLRTAGTSIERILGVPQDIEFAFFQRSLWILQSRPITGLQQSSTARSLEKY